MSTDDTDRKKMFKDGLCGLGEIFSKSTSNTMLKMYYVALEDLSIEQVRIAITRAAKECKFFPTPAHLIELSGYATLERRALIAWQDAVNAVLRHGYPRHVNFEDRIINAVIRGLGGWVTFNALFTSARDEDFLRLKFIKNYEHFSGFLDDNSPQCDYLTGLNAVEPPFIHKIASSIPEGCLTHADRYLLPQPNTQSKPSVGMLQGVN
jgi:hypothetical protein